MIWSTHCCYPPHLKDDALARWIEAFDKARVAAKAWNESFEKAMYLGNVLQKKLQDEKDENAKKAYADGWADKDFRKEISELLQQKEKLLCQWLKEWQINDLLQLWFEGVADCSAPAPSMEEAAAQQQTVAASTLHLNYLTTRSEDSDEEDIDEEDSDDQWQRLEVAVNNAKEDREAAEKKTAEKKTAMAICVVMTSGNAFMLDVEANETIDNVKAKIQAFEEDIPVSNDLVVELPRSRTLSSYNIQNGDVVLMADFHRYKEGEGGEGIQWPQEWSLSLMIWIIHVSLMISDSYDLNCMFCASPVWNLHEGWEREAWRLVDRGCRWLVDRLWSLPDAKKKALWVAKVKAL